MSPAARSTQVATCARPGLDFVILDAQAGAGGAWQYAWDSLRLSSPAAYSSLPGRPMPVQSGETYPDGAHVVDYLSAYEQRYELPIHRPVRISATGTWWRPFRPAVPGRGAFRGRQPHTVEYRAQHDFAAQRVIVVGGENSGAQTAADLAYDPS